MKRPDGSVVRAAFDKASGARRRPAAIAKGKQGMGSDAGLRDLADYGATLCFDDAEDLADPKRTDPVQGVVMERRGALVPVASRELKVT